MSYRENKISSQVSIIITQESILNNKDIGDFIENEKKRSDVVLKSIRDKNLVYSRAEIDFLDRAKKIRIYLFGTYCFNRLKYFMMDNDSSYPYFDILNCTLSAIRNKDDKDVHYTVLLKEGRNNSDTETHIARILNLSFLSYSGNILYAKTALEYFDKIRELCTDNETKKMITPKRNCETRGESLCETRGEPIYETRGEPIYENRGEPIYEELCPIDAGSIDNNNGIMQVVVKDEFDRRPNRQRYASNDNVDALLSNRYRQSLRLADDSPSYYGKRHRPVFESEDDGNECYVRMDNNNNNNYTPKKTRYHYGGEPSRR